MTEFSRWFLVIQGPSQVCLRYDLDSSKRPQRDVHPVMFEGVPVGLNSDVEKHEKPWKTMNNHEKTQICRW